MNADIDILERLTTLDEYRTLCTAVGWERAINFDVALKSLSRSLYGVVAVDDEKPVGMGRIVGDGAMYFYLQDIAVDPAYQGQGIGARIMDHLMQYVREQANGPVFVGLFSTPMAETLYERYGFRRGDMAGMFQVVVN